MCVPLESSDEWDPLLCNWGKQHLISCLTLKTTLADRHPPSEVSEVVMGYAQFLTNKNDQNEATRSRRKSVLAGPTAAHERQNAPLGVVTSCLLLYTIKSKEDAVITGSGNGVTTNVSDLNEVQLTRQEAFRTAFSRSRQFDAQ